MVCVQEFLKCYRCSGFDQTLLYSILLISQAVTRHRGVWQDYLQFSSVVTHYSRVIIAALTLNGLSSPCGMLKKGVLVHVIVSLVMLCEIYKLATRGVPSFLLLSRPIRKLTPPPSPSCVSSNIHQSSSGRERVKTRVHLLTHSAFTHPVQSCFRRQCFMGDGMLPWRTRTWSKLTG